MVGVHPTTRLCLHTHTHTKGANFQYEAKARPSYPKEAIRFLSKELLPLLPTTTTTTSILDLGAGTGIMTKLLVEEGYTVTAVEPVDAMREKLSESLPNVTCLKGTAWSIPVESQSQDAVMLAQCFHWFDDIESLKEIHRVLKPGGLVVLIWNMESKERSEWVAKLRALYEQFDGAAPQYRKGYWKKAFESPEASAMYDDLPPLKHKRFEFDTLAKRGDIWTRILSKSYIAILDDEKKEALRKNVEAVLEDPQYALPKNGDLETTFTYPHDTDMYWCYKKKV